MVKQSIEAGKTLTEPAQTSEFKRFKRVFFSRGLVVFGLVIITLLLISAAFAPFIAPYDPYKNDLANYLQSPSSAHWLGTDAVGRDTLSRLIYGTRITLMVGVVALGTATVAGMAIGLAAGYFGGWLQAFLMRFVDALMAFPLLVLALVVAALLGPGLSNVMIALGIAMLPGFARIMCAQVLSVKENDYVMAGVADGGSNLRIMLRHIMPNCFPPLIVNITMSMGMTILAEAGLSFLGVGIEQPTAAWGAMVNDGYKYLFMNPVLSFAPGVAIMLTVFSFNMVGDGLRDALDPKLRGTM
jgi:peptide/nickel transport system permease protein